MKRSKLLLICILYLAGISACKKDAPPGAKMFNPLGDYLWDVKQWYATDSISVPLDTVSSFFGKSITFSADDSSSNPLVVEVASGYYFYPRYVLQFINTGGGDSSYKLSSVFFNQSDLEFFLTDTGFTLIDGPNILIEDYSNEVFEFQYTVSSNGNSRYIVDKYYKK